jgi:hypothetical protein
MGVVKYVPYKSVMKQAIKLAKDAGLNVTLDKISGDYKVTTKNGELIKSPLTTLFSETIGKDPAYAEMFRAKAYVQRNDWAQSKVNMGEYGDLKSAQLGYLQNVDKQNKAKIDQAAADLSIDVGHLDQKVKDMELAYERGEFQQGSDKFNEYAQLVQLQQSAKQAQSFTSQVQAISEMKNNKAAIETMSDNIDNQNAYTFFNEELSKAVNTLAYKDAEQTLEADKFAEMKYANKYKMSEMALQHQYDMAEEQQSFQNKLDLEAYKKKIGHSSYSDKGSGTGSITASDTYIQKKNEAENYGATKDEQIRIELQKLHGGPVPTQAAINSWEDIAKGSGTEAEKAKSNLKDYKKAKSIAEAKYLKLQRDANEAAVKFGEIPKYRNVLTYTDIATFNNQFDWDYQDAWHRNTKDALKIEFPKMTLDDYNSVFRSKDFDQTKPVYDQLEAAMRNKFNK